MCLVIKTFRHKGLEQFFKVGKVFGIQAAHARRLRLILTALNVAKSPRDMGLPGLKLHPLKGRMQGLWSVSVSGNYRVTFRFAGGDVFEVDYADYH